MVDDVPDDSVDAKRRFNDVRNVPFPRLLDRLLIGFDVFLGNHNRRPVFEGDFARKGRGFRQGLNRSFHRTRKGLERRSSRCTVDGPGIDRDGSRFVEFTTSTQRFARCLFVALEVVATPVSNPDALNPTVAALDFSVPAVNGVMRHLVLFVLSEAQSVGVNANINKKIPGDSHEPRDR